MSFHSSLLTFSFPMYYCIKKSDQASAIPVSLSTNYTSEINNYIFLRTHDIYIYPNFYFCHLHLYMQIHELAPDHDFSITHSSNRLLFICVTYSYNNYQNFSVLVISLVKSLISMNNHLH